MTNIFPSSLVTATQADWREDCHRNILRCLINLALMTFIPKFFISGFFSPHFYHLQEKNLLTDFAKREEEFAASHKTTGRGKKMLKIANITIIGNYFMMQSFKPHYHYSWGCPMGGCTQRRAA